MNLYEFRKVFELLKVLLILLGVGILPSLFTMHTAHATSLARSRSPLSLLALMLRDEFPSQTLVIYFNCLLAI